MALRTRNQKAALVTATFSNRPVFNDAKSTAARRAIYDDMETIELRFAGDPLKVLVFPAHERDPNATREALDNGEIGPGEEVTYAQAYGKQYMAWKLGEGQEASGTKLQAMGLSAAKVSELKALNVHTVEALEAIDGQPLKALGMEGRRLKTAAAEWLKENRPTDDGTELARLREENARLKAAVRDGVDKLRGTKGGKAAADELEQSAEKKPEVRIQDIPEAPIAAFAGAPPAGRLTTPGPSQAADDGTGDYEHEPTPDDETEEKDISEFTDDELRAYIEEQTGKPPAKKASRAKLEQQALQLAAAGDGNEE